VSPKWLQKHVSRFLILFLPYDELKAEKTRDINLLMRPERTVKSVEERQEDDEKGEEVHDGGWAE
jgi:hypothetical protein